MSIVRITVGVVYGCSGHRGRTICTSAKRVTTIGLEGRSSRGIVWDLIW